MAFITKISMARVDKSPKPARDSRFLKKYTSMAMKPIVRRINLKPKRRISEIPASDFQYITSILGYELDMAVDPDVSEPETTFDIEMDMDTDDTTKMHMIAYKSTEMDMDMGTDESTDMDIDSDCDLSIFSSSTTSATASFTSTSFPPPSLASSTSKVIIDLDTEMEDVLETPEEHFDSIPPPDIPRTPVSRTGRTTLTNVPLPTVQYIESTTPTNTPPPASQLILGFYHDPVSSCLSDQPLHPSVESIDHPTSREFSTTSISAPPTTPPIDAQHLPSPHSLLSIQVPIDATNTPPNTMTQGSGRPRAPTVLQPSNNDINNTPIDYYARAANRDFVEAQRQAENIALPESDDTDLRGDTHDVLLIAANTALPPPEEEILLPTTDVAITLPEEDDVHPAADMNPSPTEENLLDQESSASAVIGQCETASKVEEEFISDGMCGRENMQDIQENAIEVLDQPDVASTPADGVQGPQNNAGASSALISEDITSGADTEMDEQSGGEIQDNEEYSGEWEVVFDVNSPNSSNPTDPVTNDADHPNATDPPVSESEMDISASSPIRFKRKRDVNTDFAHDSEDTPAHKYRIYLDSDDEEDEGTHGDEKAEEIDSDEGHEDPSLYDVEYGQVLMAHFLRELLPGIAARVMFPPAKYNETVQAQEAESFADWLSSQSLYDEGKYFIEEVFETQHEMGSDDLIDMLWTWYEERIFAELPGYEVAMNEEDTAVLDQDLEDALWDYIDEHPPSKDASVA